MFRVMQVLRSTLAGAVCGLAIVPSALYAADVSAVRSWKAPDNTRLVLDLNAPVTYRLSHESTPAQLVLDIDASASQVLPENMPKAIGPVRQSRFERVGAQLRLIVDLTAEVNPKIFQLPPNEKYSQRLVVDLFDRQAQLAKEAAEEKAKTEPAQPTLATMPPPSAVSEPVLPVTAAPAEVVVSAPALITPPAPVADSKAAEPPAPPVLLTPKETLVSEKPQGRNIVIAIDAGHGGEDPGAIGKENNYEKHVVLAIAKELKEQFESEPGIKAELTRTGDYFLPLAERRKIARNKIKADIFISIHADAAENRKAHGASVFALSLKGAGAATSSFARMLAERENRADLIGGVAIEKNDDVLRNVLADMVVAGSLEHSLHMGKNILSQMHPVVGKLHSPRVEQAGFAVLKEPGMVSLLVETGFISNPEEEQKLINKKHQRDLAVAIKNGTRNYLMQYPVPGTYFAWMADRQRKPTNTAIAANNSASSSFTRHRVEPGDTLSRIASRYNASAADIRSLNRMNNDTVKLGQLLRIPTP